MFNLGKSIAHAVLVGTTIVTAASVTTWSEPNCNAGDVKSWTGTADTCHVMTNVKSLVVNTVQAGCKCEHFLPFHRYLDFEETSQQRSFTRQLSILTLRTC